MLISNQLSCIPFSDNFRQDSINKEMLCCIYCTFEKVLRNVFGHSSSNSAAGTKNDSGDLDILVPLSAPLPCLFCDLTWIPSQSSQANNGLTGLLPFQLVCHGIKLHKSHFSVDRRRQPSTRVQSPRDEH